MAWPRNRTAAPGVRRSRRRRATLRPDGMVGVELERSGNSFLPADGRSGDGRVDCVPTDWRDTDPIGQRARRLTVGPHLTILHEAPTKNTKPFLYMSSTKRFRDLR